MNNVSAISLYLEKVKTAPEALEFSELMDVLEAHYTFIPTEFKNGTLVNLENENQGSCKLFSFARLHGLNEAETVACFGAFYREDVLLNPDGDNHQNIRNFMNSGWEGIEFSGDALQLKV